MYSIYSQVLPRSANSVQQQLKTVLFIDCGGGTIDAATFTIKKLAPVRLDKEVVKAEGKSYIRHYNIGLLV